MKKTLLIVEDNLILCDILERWLQKAGYRAVSYTHLTLPTT